MKTDEGGEEIKKRTWIALAAAALLTAALLALSKVTIRGWVIATILFAAFVPIRRRLGGRAAVFAWLGLAVLLAATLKLSGPTERRMSAYYEDVPAVTGIVRVAQGELTGVYSLDRTVEIYAGIPYAKPPVGELRWTEPQEPEPWEGVRACDTFAPLSMQRRRSPLVDSLVTLYSYHSFRYDPLNSSRSAVSEDSLYLNVWKSAGELENAPVLVYFHGGRLIGGGSLYGETDGESLAARGVVVVSVGYRLGVFGYLALDELAAESPNGTTGNYGLLDQIAALRWVRENIAAFGGDPDNVTIAGQSAGASSVGAMCVSPLAKGLFRRAIAESSGITAVKPYHTLRSFTDALALGGELMKEQRAANVEELRAIPAEKLVRSACTFDAMTVDGYAIIEQPYLTYERGANNEEALLNGFNAREADLFLTGRVVTVGNYRELLCEILGDRADEAAALRPAATGAKAHTAVNAAYSAAWFGYSHHDWSRRLTAQGKSVYEYCFTRENSRLSNHHGGELPYAYGNLWLYPDIDDYDDLLLSEIMQRYWVNFARTGDPNSPELPRWETFADEPDRPLRLDAQITHIDDPLALYYPLIEAYQNEFR